MPNPFYYGGHVSPEQFVGRKAELQRIFAALEVAHSGQMQSVSVVGPRRIGKSSLLFYIANRYSQYLRQHANYRVAYVDLQDAECKKLGGLLRKILEGLKLAQPSRPMTLPKFQDAILDLKHSATYPVVCLDEFEELTHVPDEFTIALYDSWRYLMNDSAVAFITSSKSPLIELADTESLTSQFFNVFTHIPLGEFTDDEARELIARGAECDRPFALTEQGEILTLAGNHPYKIQLAGSLIYQAKADGAVEWNWVRREFQRQVKQVGIEDNTIAKTARGKFGGALKWLLVDLPKMIGRAILESIFFRKKDEISESTTWFIGASAIVFLILVIVGIIALDWKTINEIIIGRLRGTAK